MLARKYTILVMIIWGDVVEQVFSRLAVSEAEQESLYRELLKKDKWARPELGLFSWRWVYLVTIRPLLAYLGIRLGGRFFAYPFACEVMACLGKGYSEATTQAVLTEIFAKWEFRGMDLGLMYRLIELGEFIRRLDRAGQDSGAEGRLQQTTELGSGIGSGSGEGCDTASSQAPQPGLGPKTTSFPPDGVGSGLGPKPWPQTGVASPARSAQARRGRSGQVIRFVRPGPGLDKVGDARGDR